MTITESAKDHLAAVLKSAEEEKGEEGCFRLVRGEDNQFAMVFGNEMPSDQTIEHDGRTVLALEEEIAPMLEGRTLDVEETPQGQVVLTLK